MFKSDYDQIIRENFDLTDRTTRKYIIALEDAGQEQLLAALSSALYDKIVAKVTDIDFGTIPMSRGDITKVQGFDNTEECLNIIRKLVIEYKQDPSIVDVVITAIDNVKDRKGQFMKAYALNVEFPMVIYNTIVLSIERSVSMLISTCLEFVKDPATMTTKAALDKVAYTNTMDDLLFKQLINWNNMCNNKTIDKCMDAVLKNPPKAAAIKAARANRKKVAKEDVEMQYGVVAPVNDDEDSFDDTNGSDFTPEYADDMESPFIPGNTVEPEDVGGPAEDDAPTADPDQETNPTPSSYDNDDDVDSLLAQVNGQDDTVEPDKIPSVVPGDSVTDDAESINEYEGNDTDAEDGFESDQKDLPIAADTAVGVDNVGSDNVGVDAGENEENVSESLIGGMTLTGALIAGGGLLAAPFLGKAIVTGIYEIIKLVIGLLRMLVYGLYYTSFKFSDFLSVQADLIEANANELQYSTTTTLSDSDREKTVKKQLKIAKKMREWANKFSMDSKQTSNNVMKELDKDSKEKYTIDPYAGDDSLF